MILHDLDIEEVFFCRKDRVRLGKDDGQAWEEAEHELPFVIARSRQTLMFCGV